MVIRSQRRSTTRTQTVGQIPDKMYFRIGEVAAIVGVKPYVLRYWETEFPSLKPQKSRTRQRMYRRRDVELLLRIKQLLYERKYTIAGARQLLKTGAPLPPEAGAAVGAVEPVVASHPVDIAPPPPQALETVAPPAVLAEPVASPVAAVSLEEAPRELLATPAVAPAVPRTQLALDLKVANDLRADLQRGLREILSLCDRDQDADVDPLAEVVTDDSVEEPREAAAEARDSQ